MKISNHKKLKEIQNEFNRLFPFLKLEFYNEDQVAGEGSPPMQLLNNEKTIGEVSSKTAEEELDFDGHVQIKTLGQKFYELFGINIQIFRKSGNMWLQTMNTDDWTLSQQNKKGGFFPKNRNQ